MTFNMGRILITRYLVSINHKALQAIIGLDSLYCNAFADICCISIKY